MTAGKSFNNSLIASNRMNFTSQRTKNFRSTQNSRFNSPVKGKHDLSHDVECTENSVSEDGENEIILNAQRVSQTNGDLE